MLPVGYFDGSRPVFLLPAAVLIRRLPLAVREWMISAIGAAFFVTFSLTGSGGIAGALCLRLLILISMVTLCLVRQGQRRGLVLAIAASVGTLAFFKYGNFFLVAVIGLSKSHGLYWKYAFLPLGISFFTFEFVHYAVDVFQGKTHPVRTSKFFAFILYFPTMVAGPIKRIQDFDLCVAQPGTLEVRTDVDRGITRVLVGLAKKFVIADLLSVVTDHLVRADIDSVDSRWLPVAWIFAYGIKI